MCVKSLFSGTNNIRYYFVYVSEPSPHGVISIYHETSQSGNLSSIFYTFLVIDGHLGSMRLLALSIIFDGRSSGKFMVQGMGKRGCGMRGRV